MLSNIDYFPGTLNPPAGAAPPPKITVIQSPESFPKAIVGDGELKRLVRPQAELDRTILPSLTVGVGAGTRVVGHYTRGENHAGKQADSNKEPCQNLFSI